MSASVTSGRPLGPGFMPALTSPTRRGNGWAQLGSGILCMVLGFALVFGQVSLATTKGIQRNLHATIANMDQGNNTMTSIIDKAEPSVSMEKTVAGQAQTLDRVHGTMVELNTQMAGVSRTTDGMVSAVGSMQTDSTKLASGVAGMDADTAKMNELLGALPAKTVSTHQKLSKIGQDSAAINAELARISEKMRGYGLPQARNVGGTEAVR